MMRKVTSPALFFITIILVMVHGVTPHNHHSSLFSSIVDFLGEDVQKVFDHHHNSTDTQKQTLFFESRYLGELHVINPDIKVCNEKQTNNDSSICPLFIVSENPNIDVALCSENKMNIPYIPQIHTSFISNSLRLRAPPIC